ncbi:hypothetical protein [Nocardia huaxiensis]|uniref:Uncharacterized protein n=1 Tax=Nocardia huaxiensis TaxID=2755382 RepID=A0A7D6V9I3_9NOCA|nr:hypothetical protein [Nocardia huaxiensis]QLY29591.1 hypothetical protein H0264_30775 [Nocardia huaxiensis]UFS96840.1 hypothetical protein LPY97_02605 [Nocardia huaxiensis]
MSVRSVVDPVVVEKLALARVLRVDPKDIEYLDAAPAGDIRDLRLQIMELITSANAAGMQRIASISTIIPPAIAARIAVRSGSSLFAARMAVAMDAARAAEVGRRLPVTMLADIAMDLDPGTGATLIGGLPDDLLVDVVAELSVREKWLTLAEFAEQEFSETQFDAVVKGLSPIALLRSGHLIYKEEVLRRLVRRMPRPTIDTLFDAAATHDAWAELLHTVEAMDQDAGTYARQTAARLAPPIRARAAAAKAAEGLADSYRLFDEKVSGA